MEVKDLTNNSLNVLPVSKQRSLHSLPRIATPASPSKSRSENPGVKDAVVSQADVALTQSELLISEVSQHASSIKTYLKSLGGVLEQGLNEKSEVRRNALSKEATQIFQAIKDKVVNIHSSASSKISFDPVRSEVEAKIGPTLELLFPEDEQTEGGLPDLSFANRDLIISIQTKILRTSQYLSSLNETNSEDKTSVKEILDKAEIAQVNAESSQTSVRDVDSAFKLVQETSQLIGDDSKTALFAIGAVHEQVDVVG